MATLSENEAYLGPITDPKVAVNVFATTGPVRAPTATGANRRGPVRA